jgi:hypothetical protein
MWKAVVEVGIEAIEASEASETETETAVIETATAATETAATETAATETAIDVEDEMRIGAMIETVAIAGMHEMASEVVKWACHRKVIASEKGW